jgi:hypothetical protein
MDHFSSVERLFRSLHIGESFGPANLVLEAPGSPERITDDADDSFRRLRFFLGVRGGDPDEGELEPIPDSTEFDRELPEELAG